MGCPKSLICGGAVIIAVAAVDPIVAKATPAAVDTITPNPGLVNEVITFDASASFDTDPARVLVEYQWNFGDGFSSTSSLPEAMHVYDLIGDYTADLTVTDDIGATGSTANTVSIISAVATPEPSTISLLAAGIAGLLLSGLNSAGLKYRGTAFFGRKDRSSGKLLAS